MFNRVQLLENLRQLQGAPSVQIQEVPPDSYLSDDEEDDVDPDTRTDHDEKKPMRDEEFYENDKDHDKDGMFLDDPDDGIDLDDTQ